MALPQSVDPTTLNLSGRPALSNVTPTSVTSAGASGMPNPTIAMETNEIPSGVGALLGYALGNLTGNRGAGAGQQGTGNRPNQPVNPNTPSGPSGGTPPISGGSGTGSGNLGGMTGATSAIQTDANGNFVNTKTGESVTPMGNNLFRDSQGNVLDENGNQVGPNFGGGSGSAITTETGNTATNAGGGYFKDQYDNVYNSDGVLIYANPNAPTRGEQTELGGGGYEPPSETQPNYLQDSQGNVYDENGTLIYYNPSNAIPGTNDGGGGYDPNAPETDQYYEDSSGNIFDYSGNLVLEYGNGYYYEPDTGNFYDSNFDVVGNDFNAYEDFFGIPNLDTSEYDDFDFSDLFDYGNYTSGSTTYIKDGGSVRSGLSTPLFKNGGSVPKFNDGGFLNQVVANQMPQSVTTASTPLESQTNLTDSTPPPNNSGSGIVNSISNFLGNPGVSGALLGTLISQLLNSTEQPVNRGVDMTALGRLAPRTTPTAGLGRFVPYSEYGTPTTPYNYSQLYANLGVSPFGAGTGALSPSATPTAPVTAQPTPTTPTAPIGGLPAITAPTTPTTPTTPSAPQYFQDADGNIYNANGDLVFDVTTNTATPMSQQSVAPVAQSNVAPMSGLAVTTPEASSSYYSYGSNVDPAQVLSSKKGGAIRKFADGGTSDLAVTSLSDVLEPMMITSPYYDYSDRNFNPNSGVKYDDEAKIATDAYGHTMDVGDFVSIYGTHPTNFMDKPVSITSEPYSPEYPIDYFDVPTYSTPSLKESNNDMVYALGSPETYRGGMPMQTTAMPTQGPAMPTQGPAMPTQTPFSTSPTFRFSGANNPLLAGLSMTPRQPYMLAEGGSPHGNANIPTTASESHNPNVPIVQGRQDYRKGAYVQGAGDGQSDDIPAMLADGEYVIDAETVAQLGNGSNKAGAKMLDTFRENIRAHKRSAPTNKIPPKSKSALAYLKGAK
jgi:hypothetical protein